MITLRRFLVLTLFATSLASRAASPPLAKGPPAFLSKCLETRVTNLVDNSVQDRRRPTKDGVEAPFYDEPFALHVPFEVRHEGGPATVSWRATVIWDKPPAVWSEHPDLYAGHYGVYRADGAQPALGSIRYENGFLQYEPNAPLPTTSSLLTTLDGKRSWRAESVTVAAEKDAHKPFVPDYARTTLLLNPAQPGTHVLWLGFEKAYWTAKEPKRETIHGTFYVDVLVARGEREPSSEVRAYFFNKGKRPADMADDKFYWATTVKLPFTIRRDGWQFDHIEVFLDKNHREKIEKKRNFIRDDYVRQYDAPAPAVSGRGVTVHVGETVFTDPRGERTTLDASGWNTVWSDTLDWKVEFPETIPDDGFGEFKASGHHEAKFLQKPDWQPSWPGATFSWTPGPGGLSDDLLKPYKLGSGRHAYISWIVMPMRGEPPDQQGLAQYRNDFLRQYGADAADWFVPRWTPADKPYPEPNVTYQYIGTTLDHPQVHPLGAFPAVVSGVGPWNVVAYYKRFREVEDRVVASKAQAGEPTIVSDADKFWEWFPQLSALIGEQKAKADKAVSDATLEAFPLVTRGYVAVNPQKGVVQSQLEAMSLVELMRTKNRLMSGMTGDNVKGDASFGERRWREIDDIVGWLDSFYLKLNIGDIPLVTSEYGSVNDPVKMSKAMEAHRIELLGKVTNELAKRRQRVDNLIHDATDAYDKILAKVQEGFDKFEVVAHPELNIWRDHFHKIRERIPLDLAAASKDPEVLQKILDEAEKEGRSSDARVYEAQLRLTQNDSVAALYALRSAVRVDTNNTVAIELLKGLECAFLKEAIEKSQGAIADARAAFFGYCAERGIYDRNIRARGSWPFSRAVTYTMSAVQSYGEDAWTWLTTGLYGSLSVLTDKEGGKAGAEADMLATDEKKFTTAYIGLNTILRLRARGYTFEKIGKMTSEEVRDVMPLRDTRGKVYSDQLARFHCVGIREAMKLPDVQALMTDDRFGLTLGLQKGYWNNKDVGDTWLEYIGDATSAFNLFLLLPSAEVGAGKKAVGKVFWGEAEIAKVEELRKSGKVISGTEFVANTVGVSKLLGAAGATDSGKYILGKLAELERYQQGLAWYDQAVWTSGKITGLLAINLVTVIGTEHLVGHKAAMMLQAVLMFGSDTETLTKLLDARNIPREPVSRLLSKQFLPAAKLHVERIAQIQKATRELDLLFARIKSGQTLSKADFTFLESQLGKNWRTIIPNGQASHDAGIALSASAEGAHAGVNNGASKASQKLQSRLQEELSDTVHSAEQAEALVNGLDNTPIHEPAPPPEPPVVDPDAATGDMLPSQAPRDPPPVDPNAATGDLLPPVVAEPPVPPPAPQLPPPPKPASEFPKVPIDVKRVRPGQKIMASEIDYELLHAAPPGSRTAKANQLLNEGDFAGAQKEYDEIIELICEGKRFEVQEIQLERLHLRRGLAYQLADRARRGIKLPRPPAGSSEINKAIPAEKVEEIIAKRNSMWRRNVDPVTGLPEEGAMAEVFTIQGDDDYFVKVIKHKFKRMENGKLVEKKLDVLTDVRNNLAHEQLARAMGFDVAATEARIVFDATGEATEAVYVMRRVKGKQLAKCSPAEIYLYREELARHRALSILIGDFDRKLDNYMITAEGHFVPIDAGLADIVGGRTAPFKKYGERLGFKVRGDVPDFYMAGVDGRDHWLARIADCVKKHPGVLQMKGKDGELWRNLLMMEESLTYQAALPTLKKIRALIESNDPAKVKELNDLLEAAFNKIPPDPRAVAVAKKELVTGLKEADEAVQQAAEKAAQEAEQAGNQAKAAEIRAEASKKKVDFNSTQLDEKLEKRAQDVARRALRDNVSKNLKVRSPELDKCLRGLNEMRNGIPIDPNLTSSQLWLPDDELMQKVIFLHVMNNIPLRRAA